MHPARISFASFRTHVGRMWRGGQGGSSQGQGGSDRLWQRRRARPTCAQSLGKTICASAGFAGRWCWGGAWADSLGEGGLNAPSLGGHAPLGGASLRRRGGGRIRTRIFHSLCSGTLRARASDVARRSQWVVAWPGGVTTDSGSGATPDPHAGKAFETIVGQRLSLRSCIMLSPMLKQDAVQPVTVEMSIPSAIHSGSYYTGCALKRCPATERRNRGR